MSKQLPPPGTRIAIYARFSTSNQTYNSIVGQVTAAQAFAAAHRWVVASIFEDAEKSGTTFVGRDGFFTMMAAAERGEFELVLVEDLSRLSRNAGDTHGLYDELQELDIDICTVAGGSIVDDMAVTFGALTNKKAVQEAAYRTRRGQATVVQAGRSSGRIPYGYEKVLRRDEVNGVRRIVPEKAAIVVRLFEDTAAGLTPDQICKNLNREGVPGPRGKGWRKGALVGAKQLGGGILRNRIYLGEITWGRTEKKRRKDKRYQRPAPASMLVMAKDEALAIVDRDLFDSVQLILSAKTGEFFSHKKAEYMFSGKYRCAMCQESMIVLSGKLACTGRHIKGICDNRRRISREEVERTVLKALPERLLQPDLIEPYLAEYRAEAERAARDFAMRGAADGVRLEEVEKQIAGLWPLITDPNTAGFAKQALVSQLNGLEGERQRLALEAKQKPPMAPTMLTADKIVERLKAMLADLSKVLEGKERDAILARERVRSMVDKIVITPDLNGGGAVDRRGSGPVRLTVEGSLTRLLEMVDVPVERNIKHSSRTQTLLDVADIPYRFYVDFKPEKPSLAKVYHDLPILTDLLDKAQVPVPKGVFMKALVLDVTTTEDEYKAIEARLRYALDYLQINNLAHSIRIGPTLSGWVSNGSSLTDEEWKERALQASAGKALPRVTWASPPQAYVVVIG